MKLKAAVRSMRLRTLPLSTGGVILGILLAAADYRISILTAVLIVTTAICLQVLSNLSNELGDVLRGTDTAERLGPAYGLNSGEMTVSDMKALIAGAVVACIVSGTAMTWSAFGTLMDLYPILTLMLGAAAIAGAMKYTLGPNPYGYRAKGDFFVFLFFGIVAVVGAYFVCTQRINPKVFLPAAGVGFFSMGVLNVNNIRDMVTDSANRVTVAIKLGERGARIYQTVLIVLGWVCMIAFCLLCWPDWLHWLYVITLPLYILHIYGVWTKSGKEMDPLLPKLVMATFALCLLMGLGFSLFLLQ